MLALSVSIINVYAYTNQKRTQKIYWQYEEIVLSDSIVNDNGTMYVPLRELFEKAGCNVFWKNDDKSVFINYEPTILDPNVQQEYAQNFKKSLESSADGILDNGVKYRYIAQNDFYDKSYEMNYEKFFREQNMTGGYDYSIKVVPDAETAVKLALLYFRDRDINNRTYDVFYDFEHNAWIVSDVTREKFSTKGPQGIVIRSYDGQVLSVFGAGWNNTEVVEEVYGKK